MSVIERGSSITRVKEAEKLAKINIDDCNGEISPCSDLDGAYLLIAQNLGRHDSMLIWKTPDAKDENHKITHAIGRINKTDTGKTALFLVNESFAVLLDPDDMRYRNGDPIACYTRGDIGDNPEKIIRKVTEMHDERPSLPGFLSSWVKHEISGLDKILEAEEGNVKHSKDVKHKHHKN